MDPHIDNHTVYGNTTMRPVITTTTAGGFAPAVIHKIQFCQWILYEDIKDSRC